MKPKQKYQGSFAFRPMLSHIKLLRLGPVNAKGLVELNASGKCGTSIVVKLISSLKITWALDGLNRCDMDSED